jgi:tetratricopeptide (TPR) repeat protein
LWFLATLAPVLNAHWVGENVFTERYLYLPSVGVAWLVGLGATKLWSRAAARPAQRWALVLVGVTVGMLYAARIVIRDRDWNNDIVLYSRTLEFEPSPPIFSNLGLALADQGRIDEAVAQYSEALRLKPDYPEAHNNLGLALAGQGRIDEAMAQYFEALRLQPDFPEAYLDLGAALAGQGRFDEAIAQYSEALRLKPDFPEAHLNLGNALAGQGRFDEAIAQYSEALRIRPDFPQARRLLNDLMSRTQSLNPAVRDRADR